MHVGAFFYSRLYAPAQILYNKIEAVLLSGEREFIMCMLSRQYEKAVVLTGLFCFLFAAFAGGSSAGEILIGMEYVRPGLAKALAEIGAPAVKHYPDAYRWGTMQRSARSPIDFSVTDRYVREYQAAGFTDLVFALKSHSPWASKNGLDNPGPKPEYTDEYAAWVAAVVERYDGDGIDDMPGLLLPVRHYEIGSEFSTYEPEPVDDYIVMLETAYKAAHGAYDRLLLPMPLFSAGAISAASLRAATRTPLPTTIKFLTGPIFSMP